MARKHNKSPAGIMHARLLQLKKGQPVEIAPLPAIFDHAQREARKLGLNLQRVEKKPGGAEHWTFTRDSKCVLEFWPATLRGYIPGKGKSFFIRSRLAAIDVASAGVIPEQPSQSEQQRARNALTDDYTRDQKRPKRFTGKRRKKRKQLKAKTAKPTKSGRVKYYDYIVSPAWYARRRQLFDKRGEKCELCGNPEDLQVHHLTYKRLGKEHAEDLQILCRGCHENEHEGKNGIVMDPMTAEFVGMFR
jgi:5-methylcytosine-specific restriction endonuclease McrA